MCEHGSICAAQEQSPGAAAFLLQHLYILINFHQTWNFNPSPFLYIERTTSVPCLLLRDPEPAYFVLAPVRLLLTDCRSPSRRPAHPYLLSPPLLFLAGMRIACGTALQPPVRPAVEQRSTWTAPTPAAVSRSTRPCTPPGGGPAPAHAPGLPSGPSSTASAPWSPDLPTPLATPTPPLLRRLLLRGYGGEGTHTRGATLRATAGAGASTAVPKGRQARRIGFRLLLGCRLPRAGRGRCQRFLEL
jgi:hypothetical protein